MKVKYNECFKIEERRIQTELENFEKHLSLINFNKETVLKAVEELDSGNIQIGIGTPTEPAPGQNEKMNNSATFSSKIDNFKKLQDELEEQTGKLQEAQISYPTVQYGLDGFNSIEKDIEQLVTVNHNKYLMSDKRIAFFGDTNKVMLLDVKRMEWQIKTINNNAVQPGSSSPSQRMGGY